MKKKPSAALMHLRRDGGCSAAASSSRAACACLSLCIDAIGINIVDACSAIAIAESAKGSRYALVRHFALSRSLFLSHSLWVCVWVVCFSPCSLPFVLSNCCALAAGIRTSIVLCFSLD